MSINSFRYGYAPSKAVCSGIGLLLALSACSSASDNTYESPRSEAEESKPALTPTHPDPKVAVSLSNGAILEFYEFPEGVLVLERGKAEISPDASFPHRAALHKLLRSHKYVEAFKLLRPDLAIPDMMLELQAKNQELLLEEPSTSGSGEGSATGSPSLAPVGSVDSAASVLTGGGEHGGVMPADCGNGCCNYTWFLDNLCGSDPDWLYFDYWDIWENGSLESYYGAACAGVGEYQFTVTIGGSSGGSWSIPQGYYYWYSWDEIGCCSGNQSMTSTVNPVGGDNTDEASYCGSD